VMRRVKVMLVGSGTPGDPWRVDLPTYVMDGEPDYERRCAWILVPPDEADEEGCIDQKRIRAKYKEGWAKFDAETVRPIDLGTLGVLKPSRLQRTGWFLKKLLRGVATHTERGE